MTRPVQCVEEQALGEILALPDSDPRRRHLDECPRCRSLAVSYREFLEPSTTETASYGTAEHEQLSAFRERLTGLAPGAAVTPPASLRAREPEAADSIWTRLFAPNLRPAWALAAIAIAFGIFRLTPQPAPEAPMLRGGPAHVWASKGPVYLADGGVTLAWAPRAEADAYELRFYSAALAEIGRHGAGHDTLVTLGAAELPDFYRNGDAVLYRVVAMKASDELELSPPASLKRP